MKKKSRNNPKSNDDKIEFLNIFTDESSVEEIENEIEIKCENQKRAEKLYAME